jgi:hypothetical protein
MTVLVSQVKQIMANGTMIRAVVCASTGDTLASLTASCAPSEFPPLFSCRKTKSVTFTLSSLSPTARWRSTPVSRTTSILCFCLQELQQIEISIR